MPLLKALSRPIRATLGSWFTDPFLGDSLPALTYPLRKGECGQGRWGTALPLCPFLGSSAHEERIGAFQGVSLSTFKETEGTRGKREHHRGSLAPC